ncbi:thioredoxin family protein [Pseudomonas graminis]
MDVANTGINNAEEYRQMVSQHPLFFVLFVSEYCAACQGANKRFEKISSKYTGEVKSLILDTRQTPKIDELGEIGTPTLVVYQNNKEVKKLMGIGFPEDQEQYLDGVFSHFVKGTPLPELPIYL